MAVGRKPIHDTTKKEVIAKIKMFKRDNNRRPTMDDCRAENMATPFYIKKLFGTWNNALRAAGCTEEEDYKRPQVVQDEIDEYKRIQNSIGE